MSQKILNSLVIHASGAPRFGWASSRRAVVRAVLILSCLWIYNAADLTAAASNDPAVGLPTSDRTPDRLLDDQPADPTRVTGRDKSAPAQAASDVDHIADLINQLDADGFAQRELASQELAAIGGPAIGPLAYRSFDCSPEVYWRIKKTLENICINGSEQVFFQAIAILKLRFEIDPGNNPELSSSFLRLEGEWRQKRKQDAILKLREKGADIAQAEQGDRPIQFFGNNLAFVNGEIIELNAQPQPVVVKNKFTKLNKEPSERQIKSQIKLILDSDTETNRERVFGRGNQTRDADQPTENVRQLAAQMQLQQRLRANQLIPRSTGQGTTIELGEKWKGDAKDLELLREIDDLQQISFVNQTVSNQILEPLRLISSLNKLRVESCEFSGAKLNQLRWPTFTELELKKQTITDDLIESFASIPALQMVTFHACQLREPAVRALENLTQIRSLQFEETEIDSALFRVLADLKRVTFVNLSVCKFRTADYRQLKTTRPELQITFTAQAFFGVRGPVNIGPRTAFDEDGKLVQQFQADACVISDVIRDSGADKAGMKIGDVIQSVNGQKMEKFEDLRLHIAQHRAGDKLDVTVKRGTETVELKVELASQKTAPRFEP